VRQGRSHIAWPAHFVRISSFKFSCFAAYALQSLTYPFVNIEDYLEELDHILKTQNMYVCISYDADLLAMEAVTGYVRLWSAMHTYIFCVFRIWSSSSR